MQIDKKILLEFLKKTMMSGVQQLTECIFDFADDGLHIIAQSEAAQSGVNAFLRASEFKEYDVPFGKIGINSLSEFVKVLDRFDKDVALSIEGNLLTLKGKSKKVDVELVDTSFITNCIPPPDLDFENTFSMENKDVTDIIDDVKVNRNSVITIKSGENKILFSCTGKYKFNHEADAPGCKEGTSVSFGQPLIDVLENLKKKLVFDIHTDYPIRITEETDESTLIFVVAPRMDSE